MDTPGGPTPAKAVSQAKTQATSELREIQGQVGQSRQDLAALRAVSRPGEGWTAGESCFTRSSLINDTTQLI